MNIFAKVISSILRYLLIAAASYLGFVGVGGEDQSALVEAVISYVVPILLSIVVVYWSYIEKRFIPKLLNLAFHANPAVETFEDLIRKAKKQ
jgi:hypothetical protein